MTYREIQSATGNVGRSAIVGILAHPGLELAVATRDLEPAWTLGSEGERFEVEVSGDPSVWLVFHGIHPAVPGVVDDPNAGIAASAMHCVNAIPAVSAAALAKPASERRPT